MFILIVNGVNLDILVNDIVNSMDCISEKIKGDNITKEFSLCFDKLNELQKGRIEITCLLFSKRNR